MRRSAIVLQIRFSDLVIAILNIEREKKLKFNYKLLLMTMFEMCSVSSTGIYSNYYKIFKWLL